MQTKIVGAGDTKQIVLIGPRGQPCDLDQAVKVFSGAETLENSQCPLHITVQPTDRNTVIITNIGSCGEARITGICSVALCMLPSDAQHLLAAVCHNIDMCSY